MKDYTEVVSSSENLALKDQLNAYLRYWPWFIFSVLLAFAIAFLYLRYTAKEYQTRATVLIKDTNNSQLSELAAFGDLGLAGAGLTKSEFENEIEILKSKKLVRQVIKELDLNIEYYKEGDVRNIEFYNTAPFKLVLSSSPDTIIGTQSLKLKLISDSKFRLSYNKPGESGDFIEVNEEYGFGKEINIGSCSFIIIQDLSKIKGFLNSDESRSFIIQLYSLDQTVRKMQSKISISSVTSNSSVIALSMTSSLTEKSEAILDKLVEVYNQDAVQDRNQVSRNTADFIEKRLSIITQELDSVESGMVNYKEKQNLTDVKEEGQLFLQNASEFNKRRLDIATRKKLVDTYVDYLNEIDDSTLLPTNMGIDGQAASAIEEYNKIVLDRNRLLTSAKEENPIAIQMKDQITQLRQNVMRSLKSLSNSIAIQENDIEGQQRRVEGEIGGMPSVEKDLRDIVRQQEIKESLYLYLLQKREETAISLAVTTPRAKIVDSAYSSTTPISPQPKVIYMGSILMGLLIPFLFLYTKNLLDTKIHNKQDVEDIIADVPIIGEIPQVEKGDKDTIKANDRSVLAEAFRIVRTNLSYLLVSGMEERKIIYVTSTIKGEGKTFVASNLALTLTSTGKKILLIGADIRNPQIHRYVNKPEGKGLSEFLFDDKISHDSIINEVEIHRQKFDVILSGRIPPNPAELLMSKRFKELLDNVRDTYDYVLVDTAPTMLVTDTLLISQYADLTVYITRAEYTEKKLLNYPKELIETGKLKNIAFLVNDVSQANFGYGTKYGYGYGVEKKKWYEHLYAAFQTRSKFRD